MDIPDIVSLRDAGGMRFGTEATRGLLNALGSPDKQLKIFHIAGSNGKGSAAEYLTRILVAAGRRTGTYTSPQVLGYEDRFKLNAAPLGQNTIQKYLAAAQKTGLPSTGFELETAAALYAFCKEGCDCAVVECGLGGLLDATNAIAAKEVAIITSVGLEHTAVLGKTLTEICRHKAGIINGCPAVVSCLQPDEVLEYFKGRGVVFTQNPVIISQGVHGTKFVYRGVEYFTRLNGFAQPYNAAAAIEAALMFGIPQTAIKEGVAAAYLPGRLQVVQKEDALFIVDGCHNPAAFAPLARFLGQNGISGATLIYGSLSDKDISSNLRQIQPYFSRAYSVTPDSPRAAGDIQLKILREYFSATAATLREAIMSAKGTTVVCGTFTIVKEALDWIGKRS